MPTVIVCCMLLKEKLTWTSWLCTTLAQRNVCWSDSNPDSSVSSTSSPFSISTLQIQSITASQHHISQSFTGSTKSKLTENIVTKINQICFTYLVCPTKDSTIMLSYSGELTLNDQIPVILHKFCTFSIQD